MRKLSTDEKIAYSFALFGIFVFLVIILSPNFSLSKKTENIISQGITIRGQDYDAIQKNFPNQNVQVCNIDSGRCLVFFNLEQLKQGLN